MFQLTLLFLHWKFDPDLFSTTLPARLTLDTFERDAFLGAVPFFMEKIGLASVPRSLEFHGFLNSIFEPAFTMNMAPWSLVLLARLQPTPRSQALSPLTNTLVCRQKKAENFIRYPLPPKEAKWQQKAKYEYRCNTKTLQTAKKGSLEFFLLERYLLTEDICVKKIKAVKT